MTKCDIDHLPCDECKHLVERKDLQEVIFQKIYTGRSELYFCPEHKKPYDEVNDRGLRKIYYTNRKIEVSENGTPLGYQKIPVFPQEYKI